MGSASEDHFVTAVAQALGQANQADALKSVAGMCLALSQRIERLEQRGSIEYCGTWQNGETYRKGALVTASGSLWHAERKTSSRPGTDATWKLSVKQGLMSR